MFIKIAGHVVNVDRIDLVTPFARWAQLLQRPGADIHRCVRERDQR